MTTKTQWFASWFGGPNYRAEGEREIFDSITAAKTALIQRRFAGWGSSTYADGRTETGYMPGVDATSDIYLYAAAADDYDACGWDYPAVRVFFGPRNGVRVERVA